MGWTKHPDAVEWHRVARREALADLKKLSKQLRAEKSLEVGHALHSALYRFTKLSAALGGVESADLRPYVDQILETIPALKWRPNGKSSSEHRGTLPGTDRDR